VLNDTACRRSEIAPGIGRDDILCDVVNGTRSSAPGPGRLTDHLSIGVLTGLIHRDVVDDVIRECGKRDKRQRLLPAHVVMYYVLALNLFFGEAYEGSCSA
jgi:Insertion element 4 transposase N-terminal